MDCSARASYWWANRLEGVNYKDQICFAKRLEKEVECVITQHGHCKLSTEAGTRDVLHKVLVECNISTTHTPYNVRMDIYPKKIMVCHNGGWKETVFEIK